MCRLNEVCKCVGRVTTGFFVLVFPGSERLVRASEGAATPLLEPPRLGSFAGYCRLRDRTDDEPRRYIANLICDNNLYVNISPGLMCRVSKNWNAAPAPVRDFYYFASCWDCKSFANLMTAISFVNGGSLATFVSLRGTDGSPCTTTLGSTCASTQKLEASSTINVATSSTSKICICLPTSN